MYDFEERERVDEDLAAPNYNSLYHGSPIADYWNETFYEFVRSHYERGDRVLDLGCGPASMWSHWLRLPEPGRLVGTDLSPGMIAEARRLYPDGEFVVGRAHDLPFPDGSFDVVVASAVLHHIPDAHLPSALDEIVRVLDEHGRIVGREPSSTQPFATTPGWLSGSIMNFRHLVFRATRSREYPEPPLGDHHHVPELDLLLRLLSERLTVTQLEQKFPFSSFVYRARSEGIARLARHLDEQLRSRDGAMVHFVADRNYVTAGDVARSVGLAREEVAGTMTDEEFLAYVEAASKVVERLLEQENGSALDSRDDAAPMSSLGDAEAWLREFSAHRGRPLRVLHVGNIANNAFLNAKFLRRLGVECHVMSYDYYDLMATPEWEEHDGPSWRYLRPSWFVQGPFRLCEPYLRALDQRSALRRVYQFRLWAYRRLHAYPGVLTSGALVKRQVRVIRHIGRGVRRRLAFARDYTWSLTRWLGRKTLRTLGFAIQEPPLDKAAAAAGIAVLLAVRFAAVFPDRKDRLRPEEVLPWTWEARWQRLFDRYDVVQCYATDPIRALVAEKRPYVAYEHGTLRDFTLGDDPIHRLNALAYREADCVFITNGDCLSYAHELGLERFTPMIHPVDVEQHERVDHESRAALRSELGATVVLFSPLRHDWAIKRPEVHIEALPEIRATVDGSVVLVLCDWGAEVERSRALAVELGVEDMIVWRPPLNRVRLVRHLQAADVVLDQMALPHFGATAPQAIAAGTPVVMSYDPESTAWIVDEPAPILAAFTPAEVAAAVRQGLDPDWRSDFQARAQRWTRRYHHPDRIVLEHCRAYRAVLEGDR
jgi:SAM-dependent methyltransferase